MCYSADRVLVDCASAFTCVDWQDGEGVGRYFMMCNFTAATLLPKVVAKGSNVKAFE